MMTMSSTDFIFALAHCPFFSHQEKWQSLSQHFPEYRNYTLVNDRSAGLSSRKKAALQAYLKAFDFKQTKADLENAGVHTLSLEAEAYPWALRNSYEPPILLFYKGDVSLLCQPLIGLVGARECTAYGEQVVSHLIPSIVKSGLVTVSGLAKGVDALVHARTIESGGKTIAVIGNGIGYCYPKENKALQADIGKNHLLLSEYPFKLPPKKHHFPLRNRIIAGVSRGIVVVEARERSGSLITARLAMEEGRDVFAVPGSIFSRQSKGCLDLIQSGAVLCQSAEDILTEWGMAVVK